MPPTPPSVAGSQLHGAQAFSWNFVWDELIGEARTGGGAQDAWKSSKISVTRHEIVQLCAIEAVGVYFSSLVKHIADTVFSRRKTTSTNFNSRQILETCSPDGVPQYKWLYVSFKHQSTIVLAAQDLHLTATRLIQLRVSPVRQVPLRFDTQNDWNIWMRLFGSFWMGNLDSSWYDFVIHISIMKKNCLF